MFGSQEPALNFARLERWLPFFIAITSSKQLMLLIAIVAIIALDSGGRVADNGTKFINAIDGSKRQRYSDASGGSV
jgi:hypothetical protein